MLEERSYKHLAQIHFIKQLQFSTAPETLKFICASPTLEILKL